MDFVLVVRTLMTLPFNSLVEANKKWEHFLFQSEALIRLGALLIQKSSQYVPGAPEGRSSLVETYSLFLDAKTELQGNYDELEELYPRASERIELALNAQANQMMLNEAKIRELKVSLNF